MRNRITKNMKHSTKEGDGTHPRRPRIQLNFEVPDKIKKDAHLCAMLEQKELRVWCLEIVEEAISRTLKKKGVTSPFDQPATPFRNNTVDALCPA